VGRHSFNFSLPNCISSVVKFFGNAKGDVTRPAKRRKLDTDTGGRLEEKQVFIVSDQSEDESIADKRRAATATPERPRAQALPEVDVAPRASSHEPMGSQDPHAVEPERPLAKRKREPQARPAPLPSERKKESSDAVEDEGEIGWVPLNRFNEQHVCPICSKTLQTDNAGFNGHIDWCLSRSAILEASASGSLNSTRQVKKGGGGTKKPTSANTSSKPGTSKGSSKGAKEDIRFAWRIS